MKDLSNAEKNLIKMTIEASSHESEFLRSFICADDEIIDNADLKQEKFDVKTLQPFDKVIVRHCNRDIWCISSFSCHRDDDDCPFGTISGDYNQCVPCNDETKHLIGSAKKAPAKYINWQ